MQSWTVPCVGHQHWKSDTIFCGDNWCCFFLLGKWWWKEWPRFSSWWCKRGKRKQILQRAYACSLFLVGHHNSLLGIKTEISILPVSGLFLLTVTYSRSLCSHTHICPITCPMLYISTLPFVVRKCSHTTKSARCGLCCQDKPGNLSVTIDSLRLWTIVRTLKMSTVFFFCLQPSSPLNGERSPHENGPDKKKDGPSSPRSDGSSHASTPSSKNKDVSRVASHHVVWGQRNCGCCTTWHYGFPQNNERQQQMLPRPREMIPEQKKKCTFRSFVGSWKVNGENSKLFSRIFPFE